MDRWHNYYLDNHAHFITATVIDWRKLLVDESVNVLYGEWERARQSQSVKILAYVVMPSHFHLVAWAEKSRNVSNFLSRSLGETSKKLQPGGGFWKERPRVLPMHSRSVIKAKVDYLHRNPLRKELVINPEDWEHSSFRQLVLGDTSPRFRCDDWDVVGF